MSRTPICLALCLSAIACSDLHGGPLTVLIHPGSPSLRTGAQQSFVAEVKGSPDPNVVWSVQEASGGAVDQLGVYTAPSAAGTYHVVATADADHKTYAVSTVTVIEGPIIIGVTVSPRAANLTEGATQLFAAALTNTQVTSVVWSIQEGNGGSIGTDGTYIAPANEGVFHVVAVSIADRTASSSAEVVVTAPPSGAFVSITPASSVSARSSTTQFTALVTGAPDVVTWSIAEPSGGTIDANGNYTAPGVDGVFHIHATAAAGSDAGTVVGTAVVTVTEERVSLNPQSATVDPSGTQQFTATIANNPTVQGALFSVEPSGGGTITASGLYTAPTAAGSYSVVAITPDGLFSATALVTVSPKIAGTISYAGSKPGRVYVEAWQQLAGSSSSRSLGSVSLAAPGPYVINGAPIAGGASTITVVAWIDATLTSPEPIATDPEGQAMKSITAATSLSGFDVAITDPVGVVPGTPDAAPKVFPGKSAALVSWDPILNSAGAPDAEHYRLFAIPAAAGAIACFSNAGANELDVSAWLPTYAVISGLTDGARYCFAYCGSANGADGSLSAITPPITIGAPTAGVTVSGSVTYKNFTPQGPLLVIARDDSAGYASFTRITPVGPSPQDFTLAGLPNGTYKLTAIFDQGSGGSAAPTDPTNANDVVPTTFTVAGAAQSGRTLDLEPKDANLQITTDHYRDDTTAGSEDNTVYATIDPGLKLPVAVHLASGPGAIPSDLPLASYASYGPAEWTFTRNSSGAPGAGGPYVFSVTFADAATKSFSASSVYVPLVTNVAPANNTTAGSAAPAISWTPPSPLPASFVSLVSVSSLADGSKLWESAQLPSSANSVAYNVDGKGAALVSGATYYLTVEILAAGGNTSERTSLFKAP
jgi:hypothetical protein